MILPSSVQEGAQRALEATTGKVTSIRSATPVGGGCINPSAKITVETGESFFVKWNPSSESEMFQAEADGLGALARPQTLRVPEVVGGGGSGTRDDPGWLLMEFIPQGRPASDYGTWLGEGLAQLHAAGQEPPIQTQNSDSVPPAAPSELAGMPPGPSFGWHRDNFIGSLPQANDSTEDWAGFWRDMRLEPQLRLARDHGHFNGRGGQVMDELLHRLDRVMAGTGSRGPELLHGDLWSGNYYPGPEGEPVLIDPAVYLGVGEVDLAMMELFGSFPRGFREGYIGLRGMADAYDVYLRDLYQLYYLLVHVNLFGGGYEGGSLRAAERVLREA